MVKERLREKVKIKKEKYFLAEIPEFNPKLFPNLSPSQIRILELERKDFQNQMRIANLEEKSEKLYNELASYMNDN